MRPTLILEDAGRLLAFARPLSVIRADAPHEVPAALAAIEAARGRYVAGYFAYELGYALEKRLKPLMPRRRALPLLWFGVFDSPEPIADDAVFARWCDGRAYAGPLTLEWDQAAYRRRFERVKELIAAGDLYQANLSFRAGFRFLGDPLALYAALRGHARYGAYVDDGVRQILSLSPELFFEISPDSRIVARPMKGTAARGADAAADARAREMLAASAKDRAENLMIVDLLRNDLGRVAETGSVAVAALFAVETYPTLHQMVSTVSARLRQGTRVEELVRALFPCGSVTGAPKIRAMEVIAALEQSPRGVYCGAVGHFAPDGSARFNVAIRTLTISGGRGELGIGGGVVQDSTLASEYEECLLKARYYEAARRPLKLIETLRFSPAEGFVRETLHLERLARSAQAFGIPFDPDKAASALDSVLPPPLRGRQSAEALARRPTVGGDLRIRLTFDEAGSFAATAAPLGPPALFWRFVVSPHRVPSTDALARHKTDWRELYEEEFARAGLDEVVFLNQRGEVAEGSRSTVFVARDGKLLTPPLAAGALDGVLRRALIQEGRAVEATLFPRDLDGEVWLGNSLRGLLRAKRA
jgi:para-aminobenzoate synthetase/4-amino-4-deoxychorismate lyase